MNGGSTKASSSITLQEDPNPSEALFVVKLLLWIVDRLDWFTKKMVIIIFKWMISVCQRIMMHWLQSKLQTLHHAVYFVALSIYYDFRRYETFIRKFWTDGPQVQFTYTSSQWEQSYLFLFPNQKIWMNKLFFNTRSIYW